MTGTSVQYVKIQRFSLYNLKKVTSGKATTAEHLNFLEIYRARDYYNRDKLAVFEKFASFCSEKLKIDWYSIYKNGKF